jgi:hypothetical protein
VIVLGIGGAGLVVGAITGALALGGAGDINDQCPGGQCDPADRDQVESDQDSTYMLADISTITLIGGAVAATAGVVLIVMASTSDGGVAVGVSPRQVHLDVRF